ncbi:glycosyltransferase [Agromyces sp. NPDC056523]|uniref:glycosyltransferase n=1 Tax=Agromyces sp. NPDC056523 TaxID=3345850 RepID=UPI00366B71D9
MQLTIIVPTFNEGPNVAELVRRVEAAVSGLDAEIIFVDDSTDDTPAVIERVAAEAGLPVRCIHRTDPAGGLGGAVVAGAAASTAPLCLVMDGDLQHPPEVIPELVARVLTGDVDLVVASRYAGGGRAAGLSGWLRHAVSRTATLVTKAMFPVRLRDTSDPMTGFFVFVRERVDLSALRPTGFKILLEMLVVQPLRIAEVPFEFAPRHAGSSKATLRQGLRFVHQLAHLRFGLMSGFAVIGAIGVVVNALIVWGLTSLGMDWLPAAIIATEVTIIGNFALQELSVFRDLRHDARPLPTRFGLAFAFNNAEAVVRIPVVYLMVDSGRFTAVLATVITLAVAFVARFTFQSLVVYRPRSAAARRATADTRSVDARAPK